MNMDDVIKDYIFQCKEVLESKDLQRADKLIGKIVGVFGNQINNINQGLDSYTSYLGNHQIDYLGDIVLLKDKLKLHLEKKEPDVYKNIKNLSALFLELRNKVETDESLSEHDKQEIIVKVDEIEEIINRSLN
jgi:hypothetical protein